MGAVKQANGVRKSLSTQRITGERVVVFGGAGFIGSHAVSALLDLGAEVVVFDRTPPHERVVADIEVLTGDIRDRDAVESAVAGSSSIFALAGRSGATASIADPLGDLELGPWAQLVLLESVRAVAPDASVIFPGSRLEFGKPNSLPVSESHPLHGASPYAIDKSTCAAYYAMYARLHSLNTMVLRLSNPYGPHLNAGAFSGFGILNYFIDLALKGETITLYGDGSQLRDLVYIDDVIDALIIAASAPVPGEALNVGAGAGVSLADAARLAVEVAGSGRIEMVPWPPDAHAVETGDFYFDITRARQLLGWAPKVGLREGLERTVAKMRS